MKKDIELQHHQTFEEIKQIDQDGNEFWYARELAKLLGYSDFRNFQNVIAKAKEACINSGFNPDDHLVEITEVVKVGSGAGAPYPSFALSRYACYLVVQNADPSKPVVAIYYPKMSRQLFLNSYSLKYLLLYATFPFTKLQF